MWVVVGDDSDYDAGSVWVVGVFSTKEKAQSAADADHKKYMAQDFIFNSKGPYYDFTEVQLDEPVVEED